MKKRSAPAERTETRFVTKFVGVALPLDLHQELRIEAAREGTSASRLFQKVIVQYLDKVKR